MRLGTGDNSEDMMMTERYKIVRMYFYGHPRRTIRRGLTLEQAREHCRNPETSWRTATSYVARRRTQRMGEWFDGYESE